MVCVAVINIAGGPCLDIHCFSMFFVWHILESWVSLFFVFVLHPVFIFVWHCVWYQCSVFVVDFFFFCRSELGSILACGFVNKCLVVFLSCIWKVYFRKKLKGGLLFVLGGVPLLISLVQVHNVFILSCFMKLGGLPQWKPCLLIFNNNQTFYQTCYEVTAVEPQMKHLP